MGIGAATPPSPDNALDRPAETSVALAPPAAVSPLERCVPVPDIRRSWSLERLLMQWAYVQVGRPRIGIVLWDGVIVGDAESSIGQVIVRSPGALRRLIWNPNMAFGECFARAELEIRGDLIAVLTELNRGLTRVTRQTQLTPYGRLMRRSHSLQDSLENVSHHYDLGNDFYRLWLDEQLVYTCAYYPHSETTLAEAQVAKLDYVCRKLRLQPGERVVEAGCGWGALALHMARKYGVTVQAYNLSREQIQYARNWAEAEGLSSRVQFIEDDYRHVTGQYDAFVAIGMLEHAGPENYAALGQLMSRVLTPSGRGLIHSIGRNAYRPLDRWTEKYIFPGAYPPCLREMMDIFEGSGFSVLDVENLRLHYARTCADWLSRYERVMDRVEQMFDERFVRMWRFYLGAASAAFANGDLQLFQVVFARADNNALPWTRSDWYACNGKC